MVYSVLADFVVIVHGAFILFAVLGASLVLWRRGVIWIHLPTAAWAALIEVFGWVCPLTPLENWLRRAGGGSGYEGTFVGRYLLPLIYPAGLTREVQLVLAAVVVAINAGVYAIVWAHLRRAGSRPPPT